MGLCVCKGAKIKCSMGEKEVELVNYKIVLLTEKRLKRRGLKEFLKGKYLKFYKS